MVRPERDQLPGVRDIRRHQLSDGKDLEKALEAAERLLAQAEERHRHEQNRTFTIWSLIVGVVISMGASLIAIRSFYALEIVTIPIGICMVLLMILFFWLSIQKKRMEYDFRLTHASRLAALINEAYLEVSQREEWSYLRREATRIRLSAFPLVDSDERVTHRNMR
ncbi:hypothetical protein [Nocardia colli]|uniref:hypothetical protein n=1 Tax=Nocardia colli TaxID=2545717 RepID=UPI0035D8FAAF